MSDVPSVQSLLVHNSNESNRLSSLAKCVQSEVLVKRMAAQGLYLKEHIGIILCYVCGLTFERPVTNKSVDVFCRAHESSCWFPIVKDAPDGTSWYGNWPYIWLSPFTVMESGFSITNTEEGASFRCRKCSVLINNWDLPFSSSLLKLQHKTNCANF